MLHSTKTESNGIRPNSLAVCRRVTLHHGPFMTAFIPIMQLAVPPYSHSIHTGKTARAACIFRMLAPSQVSWMRYSKFGSKVV